MQSLEGKVAIVTGAGTGIGREIARLLSLAGAHVALVGRREEVLREVEAALKAAGGSATAFAADISDSTAAATLVRDVRDRLGGIHILVHNAGSAGSVPNVRWTSETEWEAVMAVNMTAVYRLTQPALEWMLANGGGTIVTVASLAAVRPNLLGGAAYGAAKAAVRNFMSYLHTTFRNDLIRASCIMPGETETPIMDTRVRPPSADERAMMMDPQDVARAVLLCCELSPRTVIEEIAIAPLRQRDISADLAAARLHGAPPQAQS